ncbi:MAG: tyrosine-type recombinase/integrase [Bacteroidaceae bacterium]|nr:site-specific integrase [Bacteroidaceae bacterium]
MKTAKEFTVIGRAMATIAGFDRVYRTLEQQVVLRGQAKSTFENYIHRIAQVSLHFNRLPEEVSTEELNEFLASLAVSAVSPSRSAFKHSVYGLRYYYRYVGLPDRAIKLPSLKKDAKLPTIFNKSELRLLFKAPTLLKHRVLLMLIYSAGLRSSEVINLKISDIDFERCSIHIRRSKYNKDRLVPLSEYMAHGLKQYFTLERPLTWLFNGKTLGMPYSSKAISWVMREAVKTAGIAKDVTVHTLRHSYATHLIEDGLNIVTVKDLLGHSKIETTMIYLHIAQCPLVKAHSPLDTLYPQALIRK